MYTNSTHTKSTRLDARIHFLVCFFLKGYCVLDSVHFLVCLLSVCLRCWTCLFGAFMLVHCKLLDGNGAFGA